MPYIKQERRKELDPIIDELLAKLFELTEKDPISDSDFIEGDLNYVFSKTCKKLFEQDTNYSTANKLIGVLETVKLEAYRTYIGNYEITKCIENGDI